jgi:hypothetical protein
MVCVCLLPINRHSCWLFKCPLFARKCINCQNCSGLHSVGFLCKVLERHNFKNFMLCVLQSKRDNKIKKVWLLYVHSQFLLTSNLTIQLSIPKDLVPLCLTLSPRPWKIYWLQTDIKNIHFSNSFLPCKCPLALVLYSSQGANFDPSRRLCPLRANIVP